MDEAHGHGQTSSKISQAHHHNNGDGWAAGVSSGGGATSPPPRPAVPPKPGAFGSKIIINNNNTPIASVVTAGKQPSSSRRHSAADASSSSSSNMQHGRFSEPAGPISNNFQSCAPASKASSPTSPKPVLPSPTGASANPQQHRASKPALPPKPVVSPSILSSPPLTKYPPNSKTPPKFPTQQQVAGVDNANVVNNNNNVSPPPPPSTESSSVTNGEQNGNLHSPPPFLRAKPPQPRPPPPVSLFNREGGDSRLSPRITSPPHSRPTSSALFNFSSPIQNLNSANFPFTSAGLNQIGGGQPPPRQSFTSPQKLTEIRAKSASLGRNITFPFSTPSSAPAAASGGGFFARKSATLSKFLPLDLHIGGGPKSPPAATATAPAAASVTSPSRPRPNTFSLNPFIVQQKQQQQQKQNQPQMSQVNPPLNFGRSIAFSPDSPLPPPPPPRLKKKLSPVNSLGSPNSPTSPYPIGAVQQSNNLFSLAPTSPLPPPPPISPAAMTSSISQIEAIRESAEDMAAIYAEVNKEKKWAERKLKQEEQTRKLSLDSSLPSPTHETVTGTLQYSSSSANANTVIMSDSSQNVNINSKNQIVVKTSNASNDNDPLKRNEQVATETCKNTDIPMSRNSTQEAETEVVKSWLMSHVKNGGVSSSASSSDSNLNSTLSPNNPFRSVSPTYQSAQTGHIYETIGEHLKDGLNNNNNKIGNTNNNGKNNNILHDTATVTSVDIQETSEVIRTDELSDNKSFLFKLVINPKKVTDAEPTSKEFPLKNENNSGSSHINMNEDDINAENHNKSIVSAISDAESNKICKTSAADDDDGSSIHVDEVGIDTVALLQSSKSDTTGEQKKPSTATNVLVLKTSSPLISQRRNEEVDVAPLVEAKNDAIIGAVNAYLIPTVIQDLSEEKPGLATTATTTGGGGGAAASTPSTTDQLTSPIANNSFSAESRGDPVLTSNSSFQSTATECSSTTTPPSRTASILRRRSWNCDRIAGSGSPSPSESSSTASSISNLPYQHRRDRSFPCAEKTSSSNNRDSLLLRELDWVDEGDLSNGALADAESSDVQLRSSAEDVVNIKKGPTTTPSVSSVSKGFSSRRLVNSIFSSFGKGNYSSSGSSGGARKNSGMRNSNVGRRTKDKTISHFIPGDPSLSNKYPPRQSECIGVTKLGRQISDSVITTASIGGPILPNSMSFDSGISAHKTQSVQFSPKVQEARIIYNREQYSSEEAAINGCEGMSPGNMLVSSPLSALSIDEGNGVLVVDRKDDEISVSSSESVSGCGSISGSVSGYEDILADLSPREKKSFYVAREILTSERTFVDVLNLITVDFPKFLENARRYHDAQVISKEDMHAILGGLPNLKQVNENLLSDLEERIVHWKDSPKIADILVKKGPFLKLYATYIKDFQKNSMHLDTCCQRYPLFADAVRDFEMSERCQKLGLKHYMLKPVQRMPQYRLLLEDYLKSLDKDESNDYDDTIKGIAIVKDVAEHANEAIKLQVNAEKLLHLQNRLSTGTIILKADRQLIKEGELLKVCRKVLQPRFFALMNDCLFCFTYHAAAGSPKDLRLRYELPLAGMRVSLPPNEDYRSEFTVISVTRSFNLVAKSTKERDDWMKQLNTAIHDNIKKRTCSTPDEEIGFQLGKEAPVWIQDSRVTMCQLCTAEFTVTFRRHHCRACGKVVCSNCSGGQAPLQYLNNASNRVCDSCYEHLLEEFDKQTDVDLDHRDDRCRASIRERFKKVTPNVSKRATKIKRNVPSRLEVHANSSGSKISGYLTWREKEKKSWKRRWFVLIERVLYVYAASEDIVAIKSIPLLGWGVELDKPDPQQESEDNQSFFRLTHLGQHPILFQADSSSKAEEWIAAMGEAVVLS